MKRKLVSILVLIILILTATKVWATENPIVISGDSEAIIGNEKILTVKINSEDSIGSVSGKIEKNDNVKILSISGKNGWSVMYNDEIGEFNVLKAAGSKSEDIMEIKIKAESSGTGKIVLTNLKVTTISYMTKEIENVSKDIKITNSNNKNTNDSEENKENGNSGGESASDKNKNESKTNGQNTDNNKKNTENDSNQKILNINTKSTNAKDTNTKNTDGTTSPKVLAKTGVKYGICILFVIIVIIAIYTKKQYNKFKDI